MTLFSVQPIRADSLFVLCLPHGDKEVVTRAPHDKNIYNRIDRIRRYSHHDQPVNDSEQHGCRPAEPSNALVLAAPRMQGVVGSPALSLFAEELWHDQRGTGTTSRLVVRKTRWEN